MKSYFDILNDYTKTKKILDAKVKKQEEVLKMLKKAQKDNEERISQYVGESLIFGEYDIKSTFDKMEEIQVYYPVLHMCSEVSGGISNITLTHYDGYIEEEPERKIIQEYTLKSEQENLNITITGISNAYTLGCSNNNILLEVKGAMAMDHKVKYIVKINNKEKYSYERDFKGEILNEVLREILQDKYISYSDFDKNSQRMRDKRLRDSGSRARVCNNILLTLIPNWNRNVYMYIYNNIITKLNFNFNAEEVIKDIKNNYNKCNKEYWFVKRYPISGDEELLMRISESKKHDNSCCAYEDTSIILEIPYPAKTFEIELAICSYEKREDIKSYMQTYEDVFYISEKENINFNMKMKILELINC